MLRAVGFFGSSVALKSVFFRVLAFATYTSPNPPPLPMSTGRAFAACFLPVLPRLARDEYERRHEQHERQDRHRSGASVSLPTPSDTCIVPSFREPQLVVDVHPRVARRRLDRSQHAAEQRGDPVAGDRASRDDRGTEDDVLHRADRPRISSICVKNVSASAAIHVDVALASPPDSDAPAMTTAAIGASR